MSLRWMQCVGPHNKWAKIAKECTDFLEGNQWTEQEKAVMRQVRRTALTLNRVAPLWRLVMGYQSSNRLDTAFQPTSDSQSSEDVAKVLTALDKIEGNRMGLKYTDSDVFADGITSGRGFWDFRLCFENNDFGEITSSATDPFSVFIHPDTDLYDLERSPAIQKSVWTDIDTVNATYGSAAAQAVENLLSPTYTSSILAFMGEQEYSPARFFGQYADDKALANWSDVYQMDFIDRQAKRIRLLDSQYKITTITPCFVDLETGDKAAIPEEWLKPENHHRINIILEHAQKLNNPLKIVNRPVKRVRWTVTCGDVLIHDDWSPFDGYTTVGYFPYFRRGKTRGMIEDLIDPQREVNKKRSVMVDILNRNANSGWIYEENSLDAEQEENLRKYGSAPGVHVKWKRSGPNTDRPQRLEPGGFPQGLDRLEAKAVDDMFQISGINESALGQLDKVQSGRAIEARQRQAVLSIQMYQDNFSRSKGLSGEKRLNLYQKHYTEERVYRDIGEDSKMVQYEINKKMMTGSNAVTRMNDITIGKYSVNIDEVPISATFKQAQFEETMMLLEKLGPVGMMLAQTAPDLIIDQTSLPRKEEWKEKLMIAVQGAAAAAPPPEGAAPPEGGAPPPDPNAEEKQPNVQPVIRYDNMGNRVLA